MSARAGAQLQLRQHACGGGAVPRGVMCAAVTFSPSRARFSDGCLEHRCLREWIRFQSRPGLVIEGGLHGNDTASADAAATFKAAAGVAIVPVAEEATAAKELAQQTRFKEPLDFEQQNAISVAQLANVVAKARPVGESPPARAFPRLQRLGGCCWGPTHNCSFLGLIAPAQRASWTSASSWASPRTITWWLNRRGAPHNARPSTAAWTSTFARGFASPRGTTTACTYGTSWTRVVRTRGGRRARAHVRNACGAETFYTDIRLLSSRDISEPPSEVVAAVRRAGFSVVIRPNLAPADLWPLPAAADIPVPFIIVASMGGSDPPLCGLGIANEITWGSGGESTSGAKAKRAARHHVGAWRAFDLFSDGYSPLPEDTGA